MSAATSIWLPRGSRKEQEIVTIEQSLLEQQVAIATLIGAGMPPSPRRQEDSH